MIRVIWLLLGLVFGIALGIVVLQALVFGTAMYMNCLKDCNFPVWPFVLATCAPFVFVLARDLWIWLQRDRATPSVSLRQWAARRSVPMGMAISTLQTNYTAQQLLIHIIKRVSG